MRWCSGKDSLLWVMTMAAGIGGVSGYLFNLVVERRLGLIGFGGVHDVLSVGFFVSMPALLVSVSVARWSRVPQNVNKTIWMLEIGGILAGSITASVFWVSYHFLIPTSVDRLAHWGEAGMVMVFPAYVNAATYGLLLGRGAYLRAGILMPLPNILKLIMVTGLFELMGKSEVVVIWAVSSATWATWLVGLALLITSRFQVAEVDRRKGALWPSAMVVLSTNAWLGLDQALVGLVLKPLALGLWAAIAVIGRTPYHLMSSVANTTMMASDDNSRRRGLLFLIIGGLSLTAILAIVGPLIISKLLGLVITRLDLVLYLLSNCGLLVGYVQAGILAGNGRHAWGPIGIGILGWAVLSLVFAQSLMVALELFFVCSVFGVVGTTILIKRRSLVVGYSFVKQMEDGHDSSTL